MSTNSPSTAADDLALKLIAILGLPKEVSKLTLTFEARKEIVAEVTFIPDAKATLVATERFNCVPVGEAAGQGA